MSSSYLIYVLAAVAIGGFIAIAIWKLLPDRDDAMALSARLGSAGIESTFDMADAKLQLPFTERILTPVVAGLGRVLMRRTKEGQMQLLRQLLKQAGSTRTPESLLAMRTVAPIVMGLAGFALQSLLGLSSPANIGAIAGGVILGYLYPTSSLRRQIKKRQKEITLSLPSVLDLMTVCMEAGCSFDVAMMRVAESEDNVVAREFRVALNELRLGRPRNEVLLDLAENNGVEDFSKFVRAVVQAEPLGVPIASVLSIQSDELRRVRRQRAEEKGHRAPVIMLLPMMGCIFPCIFILLLGPALIKVFFTHPS